MAGVKAGWKSPRQGWGTPDPNVPCGMTLRESIGTLGDNPLYQRERRRQWRGARASLVLLGAFCCGFGYVAPYILAPAFAAMAIVQDKRAQIWEDLLLTRLTGEEIVAAKAAAAVQIPAAVVLVNALLAGAMMLFSALVGRSGDWAQVLADGLIALPAVAAGALAVAAALAAGCLMGIRAGLHYRDGAGAVVAACVGTVAVETLILVALLTLLGRSLTWAAVPYGGPMLSGGVAAAAGFAVVGLIFAFANALLAAGLWIACVRAVRQGEL